MVKHLKVIQVKLKHVKMQLDYQPSHKEKIRNSSLITRRTYEDEEFNLIQELGNYLPNLLNLQVLDLSSCNLTDIPSSFKCLQLKELDLSKNNLSKIPSCLYQGLAELEVLNLGYNRIGEFALEPYCMRNLQVLSVASNKLMNPPSWFLEMRGDKLREFDYSFNGIYDLQRKDYPIKDVGLEKLSFCNCELKKQDLNFLKSFSQLKWLDLSNMDAKNCNYVENLGSLIKNASWLGSMQALILKQLGLSTIPTEISQLVNLKELDLSKNNLIEFPPELNQLVFLKGLNISSNSICGTCDVSELKNLEYLNASHNYISNIPLENLARLKYVDLYHNEIEHICMDDNNWEYVDLEWNYFKPPTGTYEGKRDNLRSLNKSAGNRIVGQKLDSVWSDTDHRHSSTSTEYNEEDSASSDEEKDNSDFIYPSAVDNCEENWEQLNDDFCDVTLSDAEYQGEVKISTESVKDYRTIMNKDNESQQQFDPDWFFEDGD